MKYFNILFYCLISSTQIKAQAEKINLTMNAGGNNSSFFPTIQFEKDKKYSRNKNSLRYGIGANYKLTRHWNLSAQLNYEERGWIRDSLTCVVDGKVRFHTADFFFHFLSLPLKAEYEFGKNTKFLFNTGFVLGYGLNLRDADGIITSIENCNPITLIGPAFNYRPPIRWDRAVTIGLGIRPQFNLPFDMAFSVNYQYSLTGLTRSYITTYLHHQVFSGVVEIEYPLAKFLKKKEK